MSGSQLSPELMGAPEPGTPEYQDYIRGILGGLSGVGRNALATVLPLVKNPDGTTDATIPGMGALARGYNMVGAGLPWLASQGLSAATGYGINIPHLPGADAAGEFYNRIENAAKDIIPSQAKTPEEAQQEDVVGALGSMAIPMPAGAVANLPKLAKLGAFFVAPTTTHVMGAMKGAIPVSAALTSLQQSQQPQGDDSIPDPRADAIPDPRALPTPPIPPAGGPPPVTGVGGPATHPFTTPSTTTPTNLTSATQDNTSQDTGISAEASLFPVPQTPTQPLITGPTYSGQGDTGTPLWERLEHAGIVIGLGWATIKYGGKVLTPLTDLATGVSRDVQAANAQVAARDAQQAALHPGGTSGPQIEVPLPAPEGRTPADSLTTIAVNRYVNKNTILNKFADAVASDKPMADKLKNAIGSTEGNSAFTHEMNAQMRTGVSMIDGSKGPAFLDTAEKVNNLTPEQVVTLNNGMWAAHELNLRDIKFKELQNAAANDPSVSLNDLNLRTNLGEVHSDDLRAARDAMMNDPATAAIRNDFQLINNKKLTDQVNAGRITPAQAAYMAKAHPDWMPTVNIDGQVKTGPGELQPKPYGGFSDIPMGAMNAQAQAYLDAYRDMRTNSRNLSLINAGLQKQAADPSFPKVFTEKFGYKVTSDPNATQNVRAPSPAPGMIRYYHGTTAPDATGFTGKTFVTPQEAYARNYHGNQNNVLYTDLSKAEAISRGLYDDVNNYPINGSINDGAARLKPLETTTSADRIKQVRGPGGTGRVIDVYEGGVKKTYNVNNSVGYDAMTRSHMPSNLALDIGNNTRRFFQNTITGPAAVVSNLRAFAPIQLYRSIMQIPNEKFAGTYGGPGDRFLQRQLGLPGTRFDPTFAASALKAASQNSAAVIAKNFGDMLANKNTAVSQFFRQAKGDQWTDAFAQRMKIVWGNTQLGREVAQGVSTVGGGAPVEPLTYLSKGRTTSYVNPIADVFPGVFNDKVRLPAIRSLIDNYISIRTLMRDVHEQIASGGNSAYYRLNLDNPNVDNVTMARQARNVLGDVGMTGSAPGAQLAGKLIPFYNPFLQEMTRMLRNFRDNPIGTVTGELSAQITIAAASILSAMSMGPDAVNHMENQMSTQQRAADATFYHRAIDGSLTHTIFSLPQRWRPMFPYVLESVAALANAFQAHYGEPVFDRSFHALVDMFNHHVQVSTDTAALHGVADMLDLNPTVGFGAGATLLGGMIDRPLDNLIQNIAHGRPLMSNMIRSEADPSKIPGQAGSSTYLSNNDGKSIHDLLSALGGGLGAAWHMYLQTPLQEFERGGSLMDAFHAVGSEMAQTFRDKNPWGNVLWGNNVRLSPYSPADEYVSNAMQNLKALGTPTNATSIGAASAGSGQPVMVNDQDRGPPADPTMAKLWGQAVNFMPALAQLEAQRNAYSTQIQGVTSSSYSAQDKRQLINQITGYRAEITAEMQARIKMLNAKLSDLAGGRVVDISKMPNWQGTIEQFRQ